jgi:hypothetical protein
MTTTLNQIRSHSPCLEGWTKLLKHLGKTTAGDEPLSLLTILTSNGLDDAIWCLRTEATPERTQRFALAVARRVEHLHPAAKALNDVTERFLNGTATRAELDAARAAAVDAARAAAVDAARAAAHAADAASSAAVRVANAAADAAAAAVYAVRAAKAVRAEIAAGQVQIFKDIFTS